MARGGFPGIPGGNMQQLMRQAQKMQQQMMKAQEDLDAREYEGTAGGGAVSCKVSGKRQLLSLTIDKDAVDPEEVEMLQDMIVAAVNDALKKLEKDKEISADELKKAMDDVQKLTDAYVKKADAKAQAKEKEIMEI